MTPYEQFRKQAEEYVKENRPTIEETKRLANDHIFPQHILWAKEVCDELKTDEATTLRIEDNFYFTEKLVNRLMLYAYLKGQKHIDTKSFQKGWNACRKDIAQKLDFYEDEDSE